MKKELFKILGGLFLYVVLTLRVYATPYYVNLNNVEMSENQYKEITTRLSKTKAETLTQEQFLNYLRGRRVSGKTIYEKVMYNKNKILSEEIITQEEYEMERGIENKTCYGNTRSGDEGYIETSYKRFNVQLLDFGDNDYEILASLTWKKVPSCKSYDVFAFRLTHMTYTNVYGIQTYFIGNGYTDISYSTNSDGYKSATNGAGFSMNLKDGNNIKKYEMTLNAELAINQFNYSTAHVFSTYQHAQSDLTRAQSMSYSLQAGGLGDVVYYSNSNIRNKYDDMAGIELMTPIP